MQNGVLKGSVVTQFCSLADALRAPLTALNPKRTSTTLYGLRGVAASPDAYLSLPIPSITMTAVGSSMPEVSSSADSLWQRPVADGRSTVINLHIRTAPPCCMA